MSLGSCTIYLHWWTALYIVLLEYLMTPRQTFALHALTTSVIFLHSVAFLHSRCQRPFCTGATDAARGAADIVLTKPGLSTIVEAIIGARKIFQRMTTYSKYTVAMTFRICFTFGLLTVIYNW